MLLVMLFAGKLTNYISQACFCMHNCKLSGTKLHVFLVLQLKPSYVLDVPYSSGSSFIAAAGSNAATLQQGAVSANTSTQTPAAVTDSCPCSSSWCQQLPAQAVQLWQFIAALVLGSSQRWRFFQLSADLTTLRWAWNKYILLYYVDSITADADRMTITLHMVLDPDLTLAFDDPKTYDQWESGLQLLLHMLTGAAPGCRFVGAGKGLPDISGSSFITVESPTCGNSGTSYSNAQLFGPQAAAAAAAGQVLQHSLVMTALNVQYGLQQGPMGGMLGSIQGSSNAAGQYVRRMSRNSFLRASR
jgi:hypothetical protein